MIFDEDARGCSRKILLDHDRGQGTIEFGVVTARIETSTESSHLWLTTTAINSRLERSLEGSHHAIIPTVRPTISCKLTFSRMLSIDSPYDVVFFMS